MVAGISMIAWFQGLVAGWYAMTEDPNAVVFVMIRDVSTRMRILDPVDIMVGLHRHQGRHLRPFLLLPQNQCLRRHHIMRQHQPLMFIMCQPCLFHRPLPLHMHTICTLNEKFSNSLVKTTV